MEKILVLTNIYPASDMPVTTTPVVHYFAKEWVAMGYDVKTVHYKSAFPPIFIKAVNFIKKFVNIKTQSSLDPVILHDRTYCLDGVKVNRIMVPKFRPHTLFKQKHIKEAIDKTFSYLEEEQFAPDVIISHWANPQLEVMSALKRKFNCRTCYVVHIFDEIDVYGNRVNVLLDDVDVIGFRSDYIRQKFLELHKFQKPTFLCYSGIPESYICEDNEKNLSNIENFLYVGTLIHRKYPSNILPALKSAMDNSSYRISFLGDGPERKNIISKAIELGVEDKVDLLGRLSREEVMSYMNKSQVFVMISTDETFGLVYLEAMSRGCITIASRHEGFDGIIIDGFNGFLCEAGNSEELAKIIRKIRMISAEERYQISNNAIETAKQLTERKVSIIYLNNVIQNMPS